MHMCMQHATLMRAHAPHANTRARMGTSYTCAHALLQTGVPGYLNIISEVDLRPLSTQLDLAVSNTLVIQGTAVWYNIYNNVR